MASNTASKPNIPIVCIQCSTIFLVHPYRVKAGVRFCSVRCHGQWKTEVQNTPEAFWKNVQRSDDPEACWPWIKSCSSNGYGAARFEGKDQGAHRVAYQLTHGPLTEDIEVAHSCLTPSCCNPAHLIAGIHAAIEQRQAKGHFAYGDQNTSTKVTEKQREEMVVLRCELQWTWKQMAEYFGVTTSALYLIAKKHTPITFDGNMKVYPDKRTKKREWRKANPEKAQAEKDRRRANEASALFVEPVNLDVLYERDKGICQLCHKPCKRTDASRDHVIPVSEGGEHSYRNCVLAHRRCNSKKGARHTIQQQQRLFG